MMVKEWGLEKIPMLEGINRNCFQGLHLFHSSIVGTSSNGGEVYLKILYNGWREFG